MSAIIYYVQYWLSQWLQRIHYTVLMLQFTIMKNKKTDLRHALKSA